MFHADRTFTVDWALVPYSSRRYPDNDKARERNTAGDIFHSVHGVKKKKGGGGR